MLKGCTSKSWQEPAAAPQKGQPSLPATPGWLLLLGQALQLRLPPLLVLLRGVRLPTR